MDEKRQVARSIWTRAALAGYGLLMTATLLAGELYAKPGKGHGHGHGRGVPELDPSMIASAVALLVGGLLVIRDRKRQK